MILPSDIGTIIYDECEIFGIERYLKGNIPKGEVTSERVVILPKSQSPSKYWKKSFVEVNLCVPDPSPEEAASIRLQELERQAYGLLDDSSVRYYDGTPYCHSVSSIGTEADTALKCHYVNVRVLFEVLNVK